MLPSEDAQEQERVLVRVTCRKSDSPPDKRGFKESLTALTVVPSWGGNTKAYFDQSSASPGSTPESSTVLGPFFCEKILSSAHFAG